MSNQLKSKQFYATNESRDVEGVPESADAVPLSPRLLARIRAWYWSVGDRRTRYLPTYDDWRESTLYKEANSYSEDSLLAAVHPDDRERLAAAWDSVFDTPAPYDVEYRIQLPDGGICVQREIGMPAFDESGKYIGHFGTTQDITGRGQPGDTDRAADLSEEHLRQAVELVGLGHCVWDAVKDRCLYCSKEYAAIHGVSPQEYVRSATGLGGDMSFFHPEDRQACREKLVALRQGERCEIEYRLITPDGETRYVRELAKPLFGNDGDVVREICTILDITESKLAERQLRHTQKMDAIGQLTGGVAHDFNNLLTIIQGNAEMLADKEAHGDLIDAILHATRRGAELTRRLLAFSRRQPLRPRPIRPSDIVDNMIELLRRTLGTTIIVETYTEPDLWYAVADPDQVETAILNLAINARDAMEEGGTLTISCTNAQLREDPATHAMEACAGEYVVIELADTGCGMDEQVLKSAFEPFYTTKGIGKGSGLGLSMVYGFARQSGGDVVLKSEEGQGTEVSLYLPRHNAKTD